VPIYEYQCEGCKGIVETIQPIGAEAPSCCGASMTKRPTTPAMVHIKGEGYPSRKRWMDNYKPGEKNPRFTTGSLHGERY